MKVGSIRYVHTSPVRTVAAANKVLFSCVIILFLAGYARFALGFESTLAFSSIPEYQQLDKEYNRFSTALNQHLTGRSQEHDYRSFDLIVAEAKHEFAKGKTVDALILLLSHESLLRQNINSSDIIDVENMLLKAYEFNTAAHYLKLIKNQADPSIISNVQYAFAEYYFTLDKWQKTIDILKNIANDLPASAYQHALLMQGICLQNLHKHRQALALYKIIDENSPDYIAARINMAIANTRQGWWTDGYDILKKLLRRKDVKSDKALSDRLHTLIGYIFLQQDYYRNSRDAFHHVELKGPYTNQALLGISLDAGYQKDYVGALNAARILKHQQGDALQIDEANLLIPYFYEKLGQFATASAGYTDAVSYYKKRLRVLENSIESLSAMKHLVFPKSDSALTTGIEKIDLGQYLPASFFKQYSLLKAYRTRVERLHSDHIKQQYAKLLQSYNALAKSKTAEALKKKKSFITDYMNQSRYGLARLYDKNLSSAQ